MKIPLFCLKNKFYTNIGGGGVVFHHFALVDVYVVVVIVVTTIEMFWRVSRGTIKQNDECEKI